MGIDTESKESKQAYKRNLDRKPSTDHPFVETKKVGDIIDGTGSRITDITDKVVERKEISVKKSSRWENK